MYNIKMFIIISKAKIDSFYPLVSLGVLPDVHVCGIIMGVVCRWALEYLYVCNYDNHLSIFVQRTI